MVTTEAPAFAELFLALTGHSPFPWQEALFERLIADDVPTRCDIPTGLGKTSVLAVWLVALAQRAALGTAARFPRRLVYVVNRRTVVDQATREAEQLRRTCEDPRLRAFWSSLRSLGIREGRGLDALAAPLAVSTLRGQYADNAEWRIDPGRPAIIVGTVDMIGSRLLFSGYGRGFKTRPMHAGFLGQGTLIIHDEAHLEPAFQDLLAALELEQGRGGGTRADGFGRLRVMALTATSRGAESEQVHGAFHLTSRDHEHPEVLGRIHAKKGLLLHRVEEKKIVDHMAELALAFQESGRAILVFARKVDDVKKLLKKLPPAASVALTGTMRGYERDRLRQHPVFARFEAKPALESAATAQGTVYLVCTSAGEVGIDLSADHLVCDLTPFDSMAQRLGRVNRFGTGDARVEVVHALADAEGEATDLDDIERARARTLTLLRKLPLRDGRHVASPAALADLPAAERRAAFTPRPQILPLTEILLDAWALTSVSELPGRPTVADWLHGVAEWEPAETQVAWRREVDARFGPPFRPRSLLEFYPLAPHEVLREATRRILGELEQMAERAADAQVWIVDATGSVDTTTLGELTARGEKRIQGATVILPPSAGGLDFESGGLRGAEVFREGGDYDVADEWWIDPKKTKRRRMRLTLDPSENPAAYRSQTRGMRVVLAMQAPSPAGEADGGDDAATGDVWRWYVQPAFAEDQGSRSGPYEQTLEFHLTSAGHFAREIVRAVALPEPEACAVVCAARFHDLGKNRMLWQRSIGNWDANRMLAKPMERRTRGTTTRYRHELGSLFDLEREPEFRGLDEEVKDLVRHLIASHHGRARPCFLDGELFDPSHADAACLALGREVPRRFSRLQQTYGRWGLAYLESLVRSADVLASLSIERESEDASAESVAAG